MLKVKLLFVLSSVLVLSLGQQNPVFPGWYADPEGIIYGDKYWIFPTYSAPFGEQIYFDAFSSPDLINWTMHPQVINNTEVTWVVGGMWAPSVFSHQAKYYFFFGANNVHQGEIGGIGVGVADQPEGPYKDLIGAPLIQDIVNGAQPIDQYVFRDTDGTHYMYYGGWGHCNLVKLCANFTCLEPFEDGSLFKEVTPENYTEGPFMFIKNGTYYFMWSEGTWTGPDYRVAYAKASSPLGPFLREGIILEQDSEIATGAGHHSVIHVQEEDKYFIVYHRRPLDETEENHRVTCIDEMNFDSQGNILPVQMTNQGVTGPPLSPQSSLHYKSTL